MENQAHSPSQRLSCGWDIVHICNFRCPYCFFLEPWSIDSGRLSGLHLLSTEAEWLAFWKRMHERYGNCFIEVAGGEPFCHPRLVPIIAGISRSHRVRIVTNLSADTGEIIGKLDPDSVEFSASFHPDNAEVDDFILKLRRLIDAGFSAAASIVAHPRFFHRLDSWERSFRDAGISCRFNPFQGTFGGRPYPQDYSEEESGFLRRFSFPEAMELRMRERSPKGRLCKAGHSFIRIWPDGRIFRCCGSTEIDEAPIGHVKDPDFKPLDAAGPCAADRCFAPNEAAGIL